MKKKRSFIVISAKIHRLFLLFVPNINSDSKWLLQVIEVDRTGVV